MNGERTAGRGGRAARPARRPATGGRTPRVAADYRINTYFRDPRGVYVNLYLPSSVRWIEGGAEISLTQSGAYPFEDSVSFAVNASQPKEFALNLRIPDWTQGARIEVNGKRWPDSPVPGTFATISRQWRSGDHIDLQLPRKIRLEPIDPQHPETVALLCGPLVLFAITNGSGQPSFTRTQLLAAKQTGKQMWEAGSAHGPMKLLPYVAIDEEQYSTYLHVT